VLLHLAYFCILVICLSTGQSSLLARDATGLGISGTIVDAATGDPLSRARVVISPYDHRDTILTVLTGDDGRFAFAGLAAGKYAMRARRNGYLPGSFNQHDLYESSVAVGPDLDSSNLVLPLSRECSISGVILDEAGEGVPDAQVMLFRSGTISGVRRNELVQTVIATEEGSYAFAHLPGGRYFVAVSARPWYAQRVLSDSGSPLDVGYTVTFYPSVTDPNGAQPLVTKQGDQVIANLSLQPIPAVRLHFNSDGGSRITSAKVESLSFEGARIPVLAETIPNATGGIDVLGVPAGRYTVQISAAGPNNTNTLSTREIDVSNSGQVESAPDEPGAVATIGFRLDSGTLLSRQSSLRFHNNTTGRDFVEELKQGGSGQYKQLLPPGSYGVSLDGTPAIYIKTISAAGATVIGRTLEIKGTSPIQVVLGVGQASGRITGLALRMARPVPGAMIVLVPSDPVHNQTLFQIDQSDSDGSFTLSYIAPGEYTLLGIEKGWDLEWRNPAVLKPYIAQGQAVKVQQNETFETKITVQ
jgi:hypothetical protein